MRQVVEHSVQGTGIWQNAVLGEECCTYFPTELSRIFYVAKNIQETKNDEIR